MKDQPQDTMTLIMRIEETQFNLAQKTHKEWIPGSADGILSQQSSQPFLQMGLDMPLILPPADDAKKQTILDHFRTFPEHAVSHVTFLKNGNVLKYGRNVHLHEALAVQFIQTLTSIPVPTVHLAFEDRGVTFIEMERLGGEALDALLEKGSLRDEDLQIIAKELVGYAQQIQKLVPPFDPEGRVFGSFPSGPYKNIYFDVPPPRRYKYIEELSMYLVSMTVMNPVSPALLRVGQRVPGVLAHGDLNPSNILIKDGRISGIIDWDSFGTYPPWWEYMRAVRRLTRWDPFLRKEIESAMHDGRMIHWELSDDLALAYYHCVASMLLKKELGHFGGS